MSATRPLKELLAVLGVGADVDCAVGGLALDTREIQPGDLFLALRGQATHGAMHAPQAQAAGAVAMLVELPLPAGWSAPQGLPWVAVAELRAKVTALCAQFWGRPSADLQLVGVTGTNGKTSTVQFIAGLAGGCGIRAATQGTLGRGFAGALAPQERTTPDLCSSQRFLAAMREAGCQLLAMEVSSHALDQGRVDGLDFDVAVFTQLSRDHLDYHPTMEAYFEAKARLFAWPGLRAAVVNGDDAHGRQLLARLPATVNGIDYSASARSSARLAAEDQVLDGSGIAFTLRFEQRRARLRVPLMGRFNVENLLAASGALLALGIDFDALVAALPALQPVPGRMQRLGGADAPVVVVDYAHTPDALAKALAALREHVQGGRLLLVFGCGGERDRGKRPQMAAVAESAADLLWITDDNPRGEDGDAIVVDIQSGLRDPQRARVERDRAKAIAAAIAAAAVEDIVLIAGKGHEPYQEIGGRRLAFDDRAVAAACLAEAA